MLTCYGGGSKEITVALKKLLLCDVCEPGPSTKKKNGVSLWFLSVNSRQVKFVCVDLICFSVSR